MAANIPFFRGENVVLKLYQNGKPVYIAAKNWEVEENATEVNDGVNGEQRDRLDKVINYYQASVDIFQTDQTVMQSILDAQDADDAQGLPLPQQCAVLINHRDGTKAAYLCQEAKFGPWKKTMSSRSDAVMLNYKIRFRFWKKVPTL